MKITPHTNQKARQWQIRALACYMAGLIEQEGGLLVLRDKGKIRPCYAKMKEVAPECFRGERSEQWAWQILDSVGIIISGGTAQSGKLVATLAPKKEELK